MEQAEYLVIGGGIAGLSLAAALAPHGRTIVLEAEAALGRHSSGRSATYSHYGIGDATVRALTRHSRDFLLTPPPGFADQPVARPAPALFVATPEMLPDLDVLETVMRPLAPDVRRVGPADILDLCPVLRPGLLVSGLLDESALKIDADALLQGYARVVRNAGGAVVMDARVSRIRQAGDGWTVDSQAGRWTAPLLVDAAGAWADEIAMMAGATPLGLRPLRRTIIALDPPPGTAPAGWPFVKTARDDFYMLTESGHVLASPVDEVESAPCDAQPEEYDIALAAWKAEHYTTLPVTRIAQRWAGLRTFTADRVPTAGFAHDRPGFFWLAGQGGYGLQTAPALAEAAASLIFGRAWPSSLSDLGVEPAQLLPGRLRAA